MKVLITNRGAKELDKIPDPLAKKISKEIQKLEKNPFPRNSKKLQGRDNYRLRVGSFRVIYSFNKKAKEITVLRVANRKTVYSNFP